MTDPQDVGNQVQEHLARWNPPPTDTHLSHLIGDQDPGPVTLPNNPGDSMTDAQRGSFEDDLDADADAINVDMFKDDLKAEAEARGLSQAGNKQELVDRILAHDAEQADEEPYPDDE